MTHPHSNASAGETLLGTPTALMLDTRLTPLERNGWQVLRMLRAADGLSPLANLGQLRRYLTSIPLGQRAGYETAWRVLVVLRLTGWISLIGQHRDPLTGHVLSELYQEHDHPLRFAQACELDASLPDLLHESERHENNQVSRVASHIQATMTDEKPGPVADDDHNDPPPPASTATGQPQPADTDAPEEPANASANPMAVLPQNHRARQTIQDSAPTYSLYKYKKSTYCAGENEKSSSVQLPPCLIGVKPRQQQDIQAALRQLPEQQRQDVLDELQARSQSGVVRNAIAYFFGLIKRVLAGEFRFWAGRRLRQPASPPAPAKPAVVATQPTAPPSPAFKPAAPEVVRAHLANIRSMLGKPTDASELAARLMQDKGWQPDPA